MQLCCKVTKYFWNLQVFSQLFFVFPKDLTLRSVFSAYYREIPCLVFRCVIITRASCRFTPFKLVGIIRWCRKWASVHFPSFPLSHFGHLHFAKILKKKFYIIYIIYNIYNIIYNLSNYSLPLTLFFSVLINLNVQSGKVGKWETSLPIHTKKCWLVHLKKFSTFLTRLTLFLKKLTKYLVISNISINFVQNYYKTLWRCSIEIK